MKKSWKLVLICTVLVACSQKNHVDMKMLSNVATNSASQISHADTHSTASEPAKMVYFSYLARNPNPNYQNWNEEDWRKIRFYSEYESPSPGDNVWFFVKLSSKPMKGECVVVEENQNVEIIFPLDFMRAYEKVDTQRVKKLGYDVEERADGYLFLKQLNPLKNHHLGCTYVYQNTSPYRRPDRTLVSQWMIRGNMYVWDKKQQRFIEDVTVYYISKLNLGSIVYSIGHVNPDFYSNGVHSKGVYSVYSENFYANINVNKITTLGWYIQ